MLDLRNNPLYEIACHAAIEIDSKRIGRKTSYSNAKELVNRTYRAAEGFRSGICNPNEYTWTRILEKVFELSPNNKRDKHLKMKTDVPAGIELIAEQIETYTYLEGENLDSVINLCINISEIALSSESPSRRELVA